MSQTAAVGTELEPFPEPELRDRIRKGVDAGVAVIPGVGGSLGVLVDSVIVPSLTRRREAWLRKLGELVNELAEQIDGWDASELADDEVFVTALAEASRIAMGTHLEEKLDLLKNCLKTLAVGDRRDDFLELRLFRFVDELSPEHFLILTYMRNPGAWFDAHAIARPPSTMGAPRTLLDKAELPLGGVSREIALRDLNDRGLADTGVLDGMMSSDGMWAGRTTPLGNELLDFVRDV